MSMSVRVVCRKCQKYGDRLLHVSYLAIERNSFLISRIDRLLCSRSYKYKRVARESYHCELEIVAEMKKLFILCLACAFLYYINAQTRVKNPPQRVQRRQPPARVLSKVQPAANTRTRAQQQAINARRVNKQRGIGPKISKGQKRIKPATIRGYWDSGWCVEDPMGIFVHDDCDKYWYCDNGEIYEGWCTDDLPIFDFEFLECAPEEWGWCWAWNEGEGNWDAECPEDPNELGFVQGDTCEDYYICINGWPVQWWCAPGQHWNSLEWHCDTPAKAGCDVSFEIIKKMQFLLIYDEFIRPLLV